MSNERIQIIVSNDGSHTLFVPELNETYHSHHGAIRESQYVFIEKGLDEALKGNSELTVLEVGFGTGLNAFLTLLWAIEHNCKVHYHTLEPYPLTKEIYENLNYVALLGKENLNDLFLKMHEASDRQLVQIHPLFSFTRYPVKLEQFESDSKADLVFYDAFAPSKQPEVWVLDNIKKTAQLLNPNGILVSYCANGQFKRNLKEAGYVVETLPGPPGKKEMTRGLLLV